MEESNEKVDQKLEEFIKQVEKCCSLEDHATTIDKIKEIIKEYKEIYRLAKEVNKDFDYIDDDVLEHCFNAAFQGSYLAKVRNDLENFNYFMTEAKQFLDVGLKVSKYRA